MHTHHSFHPAYSAQRHAINREFRGETRMVTGKVEMRALSDGEKKDGWIGAMRGRIPLNADSVTLRDRRINNGQPFVERIAPKAFADASDVMAMAGHTEETLAAFARQGVNLTIAETADEIVWDAMIPNTSAGRDLLELGAKGIVRGTSFEFDMGAEDKWETRQDGTRVRTVTRGTLGTVNPVVWPAYRDSEVTVSMRGRGRHADLETEERGQYLACDSSGCLDWYDPTTTADLRYAQNSLSRATWALADALEYLRAVAVMSAKGVTAGAGAHIEMARAEVSAAADRAQAVLTWLAAAGAEVNPAALTRAQEQLTEARKQTPSLSSKESEPDRERRARLLRLRAPANR